MIRLCWARGILGPLSRSTINVDLARIDCLLTCDWEGDCIRFTVWKRDDGGLDFRYGGCQVGVPVTGERTSKALKGP